MVSGAHGDPLGIEDGAEIVGVHTVHHEGDDRALVGGLTDQAQPRDLAQRRGGLRQERLLVRLHRVDADRLQPVDRSAQTDGAGDMGRTGLELPGQIVPGAAGERHGADHVATALPRRHLAQQRLATPQHADAGRAVELVP